MKNIAISIKTFHRPDSLRECVRSIEEFCDVPWRLYIADDSPAPKRPEELYDRLRQSGHHVILYDAHTPVTKARNDIVKELEDEKYLLRLDDDFRFTEETKISVMLAILQNRPQIGAISDLERQRGSGKGVKDDEISRRQGILLKHRGNFYRVNVPADKWTWSRTGPYRYAIADFTRNFLLIRRKIFSDVTWNENLIFRGEHECFMLDVRDAGWQIALTPESVHVHDETKAESAWNSPISKSRYGLREMREILESEYGVSSICNIHIDKHLPNTKRSSTIRRIGRELIRFAKKICGRFRSISVLRFF